MFENLSIVIALVSLAAIFAYLGTKIADSYNFLKKLLNVFCLFFIASAIFAGMEIAQVEGLTGIYDVLNAFFLGMLGIIFFYIFVIVLFGEIENAIDYMLRAAGVKKNEGY